MSVYPSKKLIMDIVNCGVSSEFKWNPDEILCVDLHEKNKRAIVLMIQTKDWSLYLYDLSLKNGEWQIDSLIPLAWEFTKIGYSYYLKEEVKELIKDGN